MDISNKKVFFLGDSITAGGGASSAQTSYVGRFQVAYPNADICNYGVGGTRIVTKPAEGVDPTWNYNFIKRVEDMEENADLIVVFGGTNDFGRGGAAIGDPYSRDSQTFYGALYTLYENLLLKYPMAKILVLTPLRRVDELKKNGERLVDYVNVIKERAAEFALPVLDLYTMSGINPNIAKMKEIYMPDGLHPSDVGHQRLFELINAYIKNML